MLKDLPIADNIPWKQRFRTPRIRWTQLARAAPTRGLVASNKSGALQLYAWDVPTGELRQLTHQPEGKALGYLSPDGRFVYYHDDAQGNEIGHYARVPFEGGALEDITPGLPPYSSLGDFSFSQTGNRIGLVAATSAGFQVYCLDVGPEGKLSGLRSVHQASRLVLGSSLSPDGDTIVIASSERSGSLHFSLLAFDVSSGQQINELWDGPESSVEPWSFSPLADNPCMLATSDHSGVKRPLIWNPRTGERTDLALDGLEGEIEPLDWSADGERILLCQFAQAVQRLALYDVKNKTLTALQHPGGSLVAVGGGFGTYFGPEDEVFVQWMDATHPPQLIALDSKTGTKTRTLLSAGEVPPGRPWRSVSFASSDGQMIQGWLAVPDGQGPFPTIFETHGGPQAVQTEIFGPQSQAWLDAGFAYLTINYRGSTTFGKDFEQKIWGDVGHWEVEDMLAGRAWLIEQGIAQTDQIFLTGWSYGGYLTLLALGKHPELWAGGMAGIAIADWAISYQDSAETLRGYERALFGGTPEEKPALYRASSPITYAEHVSAPVLIIQGRNDTRTPARPIEVYEEKMKALGKDIEVKWFDSGHLGAAMQVEQSIEFQEWMFRFAARVLGQRASG